MKIKIPTLPFICKYCGAKSLSVSVRKMYCSGKCRQLWCYDNVPGYYERLLAFNKRNNRLRRAEKKRLQNEKSTK